MKSYVTYTRKKISDTYYADPNTNNAVEERTAGLIRFIETPYEINGVFCAYIDFDPLKVNPKQIEYFRTLDPEMNFRIVTEEDINTLLSEYGSDENGQFVSVKDFVFTDNRPVDIV